MARRETPYRVARIFLGDAVRHLGDDQKALLQSERRAPHNRSGSTSGRDPRYGGGSPSSSAHGGKWGWHAGTWWRWMVLGPVPVRGPTAAAVGGS